MRVNTRYINSTTQTPSAVWFVWRLERQLTPLFIECALAVWSSFFLRLWRHVALQLCMMLPWKYTSSIFPVHSASFISCALQNKAKSVMNSQRHFMYDWIIFLLPWYLWEFQASISYFRWKTDEFSELGHLKKKKTFDGRQMSFRN